LVEKDPLIEKIASGFRFTEGALWNPTEKCLYFSDIPNDRRLRWSEVNGVEVVRPIRKMSANKCNGMTYDANEYLYICEHSSSSVVREDAVGNREVLASHWEGKQLNSPNDIVVKSDSSIYFTDPTYGRSRVFGKEREPELDFQGVFRISPTGTLNCVADDFNQPNGLCFSIDEQILYINDTPAALIRCFDALPNGMLVNGRIFAQNIGNGNLEGGVVDGMKIDASGNLYVTGPNGIWLFNKEGDHLGIIEMPEHTANFNWGGDNWNELYCCCSKSIYRLKLKISGNRLAYMR
jgi:gluconolactonase